MNQQEDVNSSHIRIFPWNKVIFIATSNIRVYVCASTCSTGVTGAAYEWSINLNEWPIFVHVEYFLSWILDVAAWRGGDVPKSQVNVDDKVVRWVTGSSAQLELRVEERRRRDWGTTRSHLRGIHTHIHTAIFIYTYIYMIDSSSELDVPTIFFA